MKKKGKKRDIQIGKLIQVQATESNLGTSTEHTR
jgi:hypothetical protein